MNHVVQVNRPPCFAIVCRTRKDSLLMFGEATIAMDTTFWNEAKLRCSLILEDKTVVGYTTIAHDTIRQTVAHRRKELNF